MAVRGAGAAGSELEVGNGRRNSRFVRRAGSRSRWWDRGAAFCFDDDIHPFARHFDKRRSGYFICREAGKPDALARIVFSVFRQRHDLAYPRGEA